MKNFFIIGAPKTGTTLLARLIDSHPDIACTTELFPFHVVGGKRKASPNFRNKLKDHGIDDIIKINKVPLISPIVKHLMNDIFKVIGEKYNASIVGDKFPWYIGFIDDMLEMFPDAKYIYTVRDPRAVYNSAKHFLRAGRANQILNMMLRYDEKIESMVDQSKLNQDNFLMFKYEEIVGDNTSQSFISEFFNVGTTADYPQWNLKSRPLYPDRFKHMPNVLKSLDRTIIDKWKTMLSPREIKHVNKISKKFMEKYGYGD